MFTLAASMTAACSTETVLTIETEGPNAQGQTVAYTNVKLDFIPYDIDGLYAELEQQTNPGPAPSPGELGSLTQQYQGACDSYGATSDSIQMVQERASQITDRASAEFRQVFNLFEALKDRREQRLAQCEQLTNQLTGMLEAYQEGRRAWEEQAWPEDAFIALESERMGGLRAQQIDTDDMGGASVTVPNGDWWILATYPIPGSISQQYRWNIRVEAAGGQDTVRLTPDNAEVVPM
jgi:hypothetical protein